MTSRHPQPRPARAAGTLTRPARRRGFTLVELATVIGVGSLVLLLMLRWITALIGLSAATLDVGGRQRDAAYLTELLEGDIAAVGPCDPYAQTAAFADIDRDRFALYSDVTGPSDVRDGTTDLVVWRLADSTVQRATVVGDGDCDFDTTSLDWRIVAANTRGPSHPNYQHAFTGVTAGDANPGPDGYGDCRGLAADDCLYDALAVTIVLDPTGTTETPVEVAATYPINLSWSRL